MKQDNTEDLRTTAAVEQAAKEDGQDNANVPVRFPSPHLRQPILQPKDPDLILIVDCNPNNGTYQYQFIDASTWCSVLACGRRSPGAAVWPYSIASALISLLKGRIGELLCARYGFRTRKDAHESGRLVRVHVVLTDEAALNMANLVNDPTPSAKVIPLIADRAERESWRNVFGQVKRFRVTFDHIPVDAPIVRSLQRWADEAMRQQSFNLIVTEGLFQPKDLAA